MLIIKAEQRKRLTIVLFKLFLENVGVVVEVAVEFVDIAGTLSV